MRLVTCEPTIRPVDVNINAVKAKKNDVASAAISPMKSMLGNHSKENYFGDQDFMIPKILFEFWNQVQGELRS
jgi:hypothetical protein